MISAFHCLFDGEVHVVKYLNDGVLHELKYDFSEDCVRFNPESSGMQVHFYIFESREEASRTVTPPYYVPLPSQFVAQSPPTQVTLPTPVVAVPKVETPPPQPKVETPLPQPQVETFPPQPQVTVPQPQVETTHQSHPATQAQSNPQENNSSTDQVPDLRDGDSGRNLTVACDSCGSTIAGKRFKCLQCPDSILCPTCEANGYHPRHVMARVPSMFIKTYDSSYPKVLKQVVRLAAGSTSMNWGKPKTSDLHMS